VPKPVKGSCEGTFVGWGAGSYGNQRTVSIQIVPKGRSTRISLNVPNSSPNSKTPTPIASVARMAGSLKLGDRVTINYSSLAGRTWMTSVARAAGPLKSKGGSSGGDQTASEAFVFVASRKIRTSSGLRVAVLARKGSIMWTFHLPPEPSDTNAKPQPYSRSTKTADSESNKPASLSEQSAAFSPGDVVALGYKTVNYKFVLESIEAYRMSATGRLVRTGKRSIRGVKYDTVYVRTPKQSLSLVVPLTEATTLVSTLKTLKTGQNVDIAYRKQGGVMWLDEITASTTVTVKRAR